MQIIVIINVHKKVLYEKIVFVTGKVLKIRQFKENVRGQYQKRKNISRSFIEP